MDALEIQYTKDRHKDSLFKVGETKNLSNGNLVGYKTLHLKH